MAAAGGELDGILHEIRYRGRDRVPVGVDRQPGLPRLDGEPESFRAGLHTRHVEDFPDDYARTLLEWQHRFEANIDRARELGGDERVRVWRIYLRVSRQGFESGFLSVYQVRAERAR
jgi:cyclopropane fatty-acyl-phospholipid synthase-like methyltransferase